MFLILMSYDFEGIMFTVKKNLSHAITFRRVI